MRNQERVAQAVVNLEVLLFAELQDGLRTVYAESMRPDNDNPVKHLLHRLHRLLWQYGVSSFDPDRSANTLWKSPKFEGYGRAGYRYSIDNPLPRQALHYVLHVASMRMTDAEFANISQAQRQGRFRSDPERWVKWFEYLLERSFGNPQQAGTLLVSLESDGANP